MEYNQKEVDFSCFLYFQQSVMKMKPSIAQVHVYIVNSQNQYSRKRSSAVLHFSFTRLSIVPLLSKLRFYGPIVPIHYINGLRFMSSD